MGGAAHGRQGITTSAKSAGDLLRRTPEIDFYSGGVVKISVYDEFAMTAPTKKTPRASQIVLNTLMMPEHANHFGNVHGGIIMKLADEAAAIAAMRHAQKPAVTVAMDSMTFKEPVHIGEIVRCTATITYAHRSSMEVTVEVCAEEPMSGRLTHTNSAHLVFVALGEDGRPSTVPDLLLETEEERQAYEEAKDRQALRLAKRQASKPST
jgi:uncharacterized protein (TIGR00369 family)